MKFSTFGAAIALTAIASTAMSQNVTTADGHIVMVEKNQTATVATTAATPGAASPVIGFGGGGLLGVGPLALGLGAIIAVGAIAGGEGS